MITLYPSGDYSELHYRSVQKTNVFNYCTDTQQQAHTERKTEADSLFHIEHMISIIAN